ncbi:MAG: cyclase family protein [Rhodospirillales bacterium]|nr:cyclase family protein [Rhodospirillales bacterium]
MTTLVDLTHTFTSDMPVYPGDICSKLYQDMTYEEGAINHSRVESGLHVGTHIDAPFHMVDGGAYVSDIPVSHFQGRGHIIDARGKKSATAALLENKPIGKGDIVLVYTGWDKKFREPDYYEDYPEIAEDFAHALIAMQVALLGIDTPSPDREPYPIHRLLLPENILIIENLTNLESVPADRPFKIHAYPAKYKADGAPVRVVAEIEE